MFAAQTQPLQQAAPKTSSKRTQGPVQPEQALSMLQFGTPVPQRAVSRVDFDFTGNNEPLSRNSYCGMNVGIASGAPPPSKAPRLGTESDPALGACEDRKESASSSTGQALGLRTESDSAPGGLPALEGPPDVPSYSQRDLQDVELPHQPRKKRRRTARYIHYGTRMVHDPTTCDHCQRDLLDQLAACLLYTSPSPRD